MGLPYGYILRTGGRLHPQTAVPLSLIFHLRHSLILLYIPLHLHPNVRFTTRKIPHMPDSTSQAKLPER